MTTPTTTDATVNVQEQQYNSYLRTDVVEVVVSRDTDTTNRFIFEKKDPGGQQLMPAGRFIGQIPPVVIDAVEDSGYTVVADAAAHMENPPRLV